MKITNPGFAHSSDTVRLWPARRWLDILWLVLMGFILVYGLNLYRSGWLCAYMGTDFRGYYASAQIARQQGFAAVYDPQVQAEYQAALPHRCPDPAYPQPMPRVSMPYLSLFVPLFIPLTVLDFTASYFFWVVFNLAALGIYLLRFMRALGERVRAFELLQWVICLPVISNLFLGQMNVWLVICIGEFALWYGRGGRLRSGLWLGGMLLKPHTLVLLLPGLALGRSWKALLGFTLGFLVVLGVSVLLAGPQGLAANARLIYEFAGPLIQTAPSMMNYRALALQLSHHLPAWVVWGTGMFAAILAVIAVLKNWLRRPAGSSTCFARLLLITFAGTFAISWHSHFYLLMLLIPFLMFLDRKQALPLYIWSLWLFGPPLLYGLASLLQPDLVRNLFGLGMLVLNQLLLAWGAWTLSKKDPEPALS